MSHDHDNGGLLASMKPKPRASGSGSQAHAGRLERPSLFAGMEDDEVEDLESDRVRLLSSLTARSGRSTRKAGRAHGLGHMDAHMGGSRPRRSRRAGASLASPWWPRALFTVMALGAVVVLYSFVQVVRQPHAMSARARALSSAPDAASAPSILAGTGTAPNLEALAPTAAGPLDEPVAGVAGTNALSAAAHAASAGTFQEAARIAAPPHENVSSAAVITESPMPQAAPLAATATRSPTRTSTHTDTRQAPSQAATPAISASALVARAQSDAARLNAPTTPTAARSAAPRESRPRTNDDVALLEAMMKHASTRRAPPSSAEAFQACDARQGAEAAVCKARACVQHPTATQCHSDTP